MDKIIFMLLIFLDVTISNWLPETSLKVEIIEVNFFKGIITFKEKIKRHCYNIHRWHIDPFRNIKFTVTHMIILLLNIITMNLITNCSTFVCNIWLNVLQKGRLKYWIASSELMIIIQVLKNVHIFLLEQVKYIICKVRKHG